MATPYQGNVTPLTPSGQDAAAAPVIRTIGLSDLHRALQLGWEDFKAVPSHAIILCVIYPVLGLVLARTVLGYSVLPLLFPLAAGFALLGPFAALGLYELSRRRESGAQATAWDALEVLRSPSFGAMLGLGVLLLALFVTWVATAQAIYIAAFGYEGASGIKDFATHVLTTSEGWWLIVVGCGVGFLFALVALCISVVSFPLMLDRHAGAGDAMVASLRAVARNPVPMAVWGLIVAVLLVLGSLPFFLGLAVVIPLLGHATWHLYREDDRARTQSAAAAAPRTARASARGGFPCQSVSLAAQGWCIGCSEINAAKPPVQSSTGGFACHHSAARATTLPANRALMAMARFAAAMP
jgi:uncharacterized membrane protein